MSDLITYSASNVAWIDGMSYLISKDPPVEGDIIMDRRDGSCTMCEEVVDNLVVLECNYDAVPIEAVYKLIPFNPQNN